MLPRGRSNVSSCTRLEPHKVRDERSARIMQRSHQLIVVGGSLAVLAALPLSARQQAAQTDTSAASGKLPGIALDPRQPVQTAKAEPQQPPAAGAPAGFIGNPLQPPPM